MAWSNQGLKERFVLAGDLSESACEQWAATKNIDLERFGADRSKLRRFWTLPNLIRYRPDYIAMGTEPFFIEVKGCGRLPIIKIKEATLMQSELWHRTMSVWFFFYDSHRNKIAFEPFVRVNTFALESKTNYFDDGKIKYFELRKDHFTWNDFKIKETVHGY